LFGLSAASAIPIVGVYQIYIAKGDTFREKWKSVFVPWKDRVEKDNYRAVPRTASHDITRTNIDVIL